MKTRSRTNQATAEASPGPMSILAVCFAFSIVLHGGVAFFAPSRPTPTPWVTVDVVHEYDPGGIASDVTDAVPSGLAVAEHTQPVPLAAATNPSASNLSTREAGAGGDPSGALRTIQMSETHATILLLDAPINSSDELQVQRIRTARDRASQDSRRATPNPAFDPFLATGDGRLRERREAAAVDPVRGALDRQLDDRSVRGTDRPLSPAGAVQQEVGTSAQTKAGSTIATGTLIGGGRRETDRARVASGRPSVDQARAATPTATDDSRVRDNRNTELLASQMLASWTEASPARAVTAGNGAGGADGAALVGNGAGVHAGARASRVGPGQSRGDALDTNDARYIHWFANVKRCVEQHLVFPRQRALARDQGTTVFRLHVRRNGTLHSRARVHRSSGFDEFDAAARHALGRCIPFEAIPDSFAPGRETVSIQMPVAFRNPMVE